MIKHLLIKDWKLLWPMVALVTAIQIAREWAVYRAQLFGESPAAEMLLPPLTLAWFVGIAALAAAAVHQDAIPGIDQDWLIRPLRRSELLIAKLGFVALAVSGPMGVLNFAHAWAVHMSLTTSLGAVLAKESFVLLAFVIPVLALASTTRNMSELLILAAALVVMYALSVSMSALVLGDDWCPTCHTGMAWLEHLLQHVLILLGACVMLGLQYFRRRSTLSRALAILGAASIALVQVSWSAAFAIERELSRAAGGQAQVELDLGPQRYAPRAAEAAPDAHRAAKLLMHGSIDRAVEDLRHGAIRTIALDLPVRTQHAANELLLLDRLQVHLFDARGGLLYSGTSGSASPGLLGNAGPDAPVPTAIDYQTIRIPARAYGRVAEEPGRLQLDFFVTRVRLGGEYRLAADNGRLQKPDIGLCGTVADRYTVSVHCESVGQAPFCYSATLFAADGRHDSEVFKCEPDYRRHWPALVNVLNFYGVDIPLRDRYGTGYYAVDPSALSTSFVLLKVYAELDHFQRTINVAQFQPPVAPAPR